MKIKDSRTFVLNETVLHENLIVPVDELDSIVMEFIGHYRAGKFGNIARETRGEDVLVTVAICYLDEDENWKTIISELEKEGWAGASLVLWSLYVQDNKNVAQETVTLPGTLYRDDDFVEWVPLVRYSPRIFLKTATEIVSMKLSSSLRTSKARTFLISKTEVIKT